MRFFRCFKLDMQQGFSALWRSYLATTGLFFLLVLALHLDAAGRMTGPFSLGDYLVSFVAGSKTYSFSPEEPFRFPIAWAALLMLGAYATLWYPYRDLMGMGKHLMVSMGSKWTWWLSKCAWVVCSVVLFCLIGLVVACVCTVVLGGSLSLDVSGPLPSILDFNLADVAYAPQGVGLFLFVAVPVALVALCLVQLTASLLLRPVLGYAVTMALLLLSLFYENPWLLGNELMAARSTSLLIEGIPPLSGLVVSATFAVLAVVLGGMLFSWMDILAKEGFS